MTNEHPLGTAIQRGEGTGLPDLKPHLRVERLLADLGPIDWRKAAIPRRYASDLRRDPRMMEGARRDLAEQPSGAALERLALAIEGALDAVPNKPVTATAVAVLFDSRARQPANPVGYLEALCFDLCDLGFQPAVVVKATQDLRRTRTFTPEIAEVIEACREVQSQYRATASLCRHAIRARDEVQAAIDEAESSPTTPASAARPPGAGGTGAG